MCKHSWTKHDYALLEFQKGKREIVTTLVKDLKVCSKCDKKHYTVLYSESRMDTNHLDKK